MLLLGIDLGTSSIKVSIVDASTQKTITSVSYPEEETEIISPEVGWAEQDPERWWSHTKLAIQKAHSQKLYDPKAIVAIGIAYQMHGLVLVDAKDAVLRHAIIWCDSRAVALGEAAQAALGEGYCKAHLLNSPGNFTAAKLAWVKAHEPQLYAQVKHMLLPGDFLALRFTGIATTSIPALSEGIFWDFDEHKISDALLGYFGFDKAVIPELRPLFGSHGKILAQVAEELGLSPDVEVAYKAGDQPNNAFSLQVLEPGEVAATAGTSGVIYGVSDALIADPYSRVNTFAHVNYKPDQIRTGVLLCINGTGIQNSWLKKMVGTGQDYDALNRIGSESPLGAKGLRILPFGNGVERMLQNKPVGAHITGLDFNRHGQADLIRAGQEGIAFAFRYGFDIMRSNGLAPQVIRAGYTNLFLSPLFRAAFTGVTNTAIELYKSDGSVGAALGAGVGKGIYAEAKEAFTKMQLLQTEEPQQVQQYEELYQEWKLIVNKF
ncbi:xylulokinase [Sphingobacterium sp. Mn56C]|uniref:xylulokinase n=1 Tax=Sphingobacterium sp. Mn56C TaxID=3395261 RepID=UPI003BE3D59B